MTAKSRSIRRDREPGSLEGIRAGESLDDFEKRVGDDAPEWTDEDFKRARPIGDFPQLKAAIERARRQPRPPEPDVKVSAPVAARFDDQHLHIALADGRELTVPLTWYPDLVTATPAERQAFVLTPDGLRWPQFHEEASIASILRTQLKIEELRRARGQRGPQKTPTKQRISLRLDRDIVESYRAAGPGWQTRINDDLARIQKRKKHG
jgi:uncharacterized protein (DUF4415 family)